MKGCLHLPCFTFILSSKLVQCRPRPLNLGPCNHRLLLKQCRKITLMVILARVPSAYSFREWDKQKAKMLLVGVHISIFPLIFRRYYHSLRNIIIKARRQPNEPGYHKRPGIRHWLVEQIHWRRRCRDRRDGEMRGQSVIVADCNLISAIFIAFNGKICAVTNGKLQI